MFHGGSESITAVLIVIARLLLFLTLIATTDFCCAFNLDVTPEHVNVVKGPTGSYFGFKIRTYQNRNSKTMLVVSAPKLTVRVKNREIRNHGSLFVCDQNEPKCNRSFFFETNDLSENRTNQHFGWSFEIGNSSASNSEVPLIACAPMWRFRREAIPRGGGRVMVSEITGACFSSRIDSTSDSILVDNTIPFYPCKNDYTLGYDRQGYCEAGISSALGTVLGNENGRRPKASVAILGAPGGTYWAGGAYGAPLNAISRFKHISASLKSNRDFDKESDSDNYNGLFGYAMAYYSVDITSPKRQQLQGVAISGIKTKTFGEVVLVAMSLASNELSVGYFKNNSVVRGTQLSEAFGFALACGDINGDGLPEIFVGAPFFFTNATASNQQNSPGRSSSGNSDFRARSYDSGRVYIFSTSVKQPFDFYADDSAPSNVLVFNDPTKAVTLNGFDSESRFGSAIDFLGDINDDGFGDVAIGAPFGGKNNLGAVYVFLGSANGIGANAKPSQVIEASQIPQINVNYQPITMPGKLRSAMFGYAVQGRYDVDGNGYPDLIIGAVGADTVLVIRSRPVVKVDTNVRVNPSIIGTLVNGIVTSTCKGKVDTSTYLCADLSYCFGYSGKSLPSSIELAVTIDADITLTSTTNVLAGRAFFDNDKTSLLKRLIIRSGYKSCVSDPVRVLRAPSDLLTPIVFQMTLTLATSQLGSDPNQLVPIFVTGETFLANASAEIAKDCGPDNVCIPNFRIDTRKSQLRNVILGDTRPFLLNFTIRNDGEEAYGGKVTVVAPIGALFNGRQVISDSEVNSVLLAPDLICSVTSTSESPASELGDVHLPQSSTTLSQTVVCDLPQPFRTGRTIEIHMIFLMNSLKLENATSPDVRFNLTISSINPELDSTLSDNRAQLDVRIRSDLSVGLQLVPSPEQIVYEENEYTPPALSFTGANLETSIGPHLYLEIFVSNNGPTPASRIDVNVKWPQDPFRNNSLLYLVEAPYLLRGRGRCYAGPQINPWKLDLVPQNDRLARPRSTVPPSSPTIYNPDYPTSLRCYVINVAAGDYARIVLRTRLISKHINMIFISERSMTIDGNARVAKLPISSVVPVNVSVDTRIHIEVVTRMADFSLAHVDPWIIAVAIGSGLLTIALILLSLWLAGCFERKVRRYRPKTVYIQLQQFENVKMQAERVPVVDN